MKLESARSLKLELLADVVQPAVAKAFSRGSFAVAARATKNMAMPRSLALGVARGTKKGDYKLAVRVQRGEAWELSAIRRQIEKRGGKGVEVRQVGRISKSAATWEQKRHRPLRIGTSVSHFKVTAGTLGCFAQDANGRVGILSNNHVLANENLAKKGDAVLQPGTYDGGTGSDAVATLARFVRIRASGINHVDGAFAVLKSGLKYDALNIRGLGKLAGVRDAPLLPGDQVFKLGRTTGLREGRVTAIELDQVIVGFDFGNARFDDQVEIEGTGSSAFSDGGDSGSVIVDADFCAAALLFAGSDEGGTNGKGLTFANPIDIVLRRLKLKIV